MSTTRRVKPQGGGEEETHFGQNVTLKISSFPHDSRVCSCSQFRVCSVLSCGVESVPSFSSSASGPPTSWNLVVWSCRIQTAVSKPRNTTICQFRQIFLAISGLLMGFFFASEIAHFGCNFPYFLLLCHFWLSKNCIWNQYVQKIYKELSFIYWLHPNHRKCMTLNLHFFLCFLLRSFKGCALLSPPLEVGESQ